MAPEFAAQQTQKVPGTISTRSLDLRLPEPNVGAVLGAPQLRALSCLPDLGIEHCSAKAQTDLGPRVQCQE